MIFKVLLVVGVICLIASAYFYGCMMKRGEEYRMSFGRDIPETQIKKQRDRKQNAFLFAFLGAVLITIGLVYMG